MERCLGCGGDVSTASERKRRRLLGSSTAEKIRNTLISFFCQCHNLQLDSESIRNGYICRNCVRLIEKYNLLHEEVATNTRKALPHLPVTAGGTGQVLSIASIIPSTLAVQPQRICLLLHHPCQSLLLILQHQFLNSVQHHLLSK